MTNDLTLSQASELLGGVPNAETLRRQAQTGKLRAVKRGRDWHVSRAEVQRYRKENKR